MKLLTTITALSRPEADEPFRTEVWYQGTIERDTLQGNIDVYKRQVSTQRSVVMLRPVPRCMGRYCVRLWYPLSRFSLVDELL